MAHLGATSTVAHCAIRERIPVPPDELVISIVAVDDQPGSVVVESRADDRAAVTVAVLDAAQAARLAAVLRNAVDALADHHSAPVAPDLPR